MKLIAMEVERVQGATKYARCEIAVNAASELAATWPERNIVFTAGSIAWDISTGDFYGFTGGSWYKQDGSGAYTPDDDTEGGRSLSAPLNLNKPVVQRDIPEDIPEEKEEEGESR